MIGYVYVIRSKDPNDMSQNFYIGSTNDIKERERLHKTVCKSTKNLHHNLKVYQYIRSNGGWDQFVMYSLHQVEYTNKLELRQAEQKYIDLYKPELNVLNAIRDLKAHKIKIAIRQKQKNACECGGKYTNNDKAKHSRTAKHLKYVLALSSKSNAATVEAMAALSI